MCNIARPCVVYSLQAVDYYCVTRVVDEIEYMCPVHDRHIRAYNVSVGDSRYLLCRTQFSKYWCHALCVGVASTTYRQVISVGFHRRRWLQYVQMRDDTV